MAPKARMVVEVTWQDAGALLGPWDDLDAVLSKKNRAPVHIHSVGYVLSDDKQSLVLARSFHDKRVGGVGIIPASAIVKRRRLRG
jgi:hypothetical protein